MTAYVRQIARGPVIRPRLLDRLIRFFLVFSACPLVLSGCQSAGFDLRSVRYPVMVSPVIQVGGEAPTKLSERSFGHFKGENSVAAASAASSYNVQSGGYVYHVTESYYGEEKADNVLASLQKASMGRSDIVAIVNAVRVKHLVHMSFGGYSAKKVSVEGSFYLRDELVSKETK